MKPPKTAEDYELYAMRNRLLERSETLTKAAMIVARYLRGDETADDAARAVFAFPVIALQRALDIEIEHAIRAGRI